METLVVNKVYDTYEELEKAEEAFTNEYIVMLINHMPQEFGKKDIYGIESIVHFGKRK